MRSALAVIALAGALAWEGHASAQESPPARSTPPVDSGWFPEPSPAPDPDVLRGGHPERPSDAPPLTPPPITAKPAAHQPDRAPPVPAAPPVMTRRWYGWQIILTDASAVALTVTGALSESDGLITVGVLTYLFGPPTVHFAHRNVGRGFGSLGLRLGAPFVGALLGVAIANCGENSDFCGMPEAAVAVTATTLTAVVIDAAVLAYDVEKKPSLSWAPSVRVSRDGAGLVVGGRF